MYLVNENGNEVRGTTGGLRPIRTTAELFPDGAAIDMLRDSQLVCWNGTTEEINPMIEFGGTTYRPTPLHITVEQALRLPTAPAPYGTTESLINRLAKAAADRIGLDEQASLRSATFVNATWFAECLPGNPILNLWAPTGDYAAALDFFNAVVRRPLPLSEPDIKQILALPTELGPTILVNSPSERVLHKVIATAGRGGRLHGGRLAILRCSIITFTRRPLPPPVLNISLVSTEAGGRRLSRRQVNELAEQFQPQLLRHRLTQHLTVAESQFALDRFSPAVRAMGQMLGATLEGAPDLQRLFVESLADSDEDHKVEQSAEPAAIVLEAILVACHENKATMFVNEVTELANGILVGRHDKGTLTPKAVGAIMTKTLGLTTKRQSPGYQLVLDDKVKKRIHDIGHQFGVLTLLQARPECAFCAAK